MKPRDKTRLFRVRDQLVSILDLAISSSELVGKESNAINLKVLKGVMLEETSKDISRLQRFIDQRYIILIDQSTSKNHSLVTKQDLFKIDMRNGMTKFNFYLELCDSHLYVVNISVLNPHFSQVC